MANAEGSDIMLNRVMTKDNIALAALLEIKDSAWEPNPDPRVSGTPLLVATAHIHWDPEFCDVKLIQTMMLVDQVRLGIVHDDWGLSLGGTYTRLVYKTSSPINSSSWYKKTTLLMNL